MSTDPDGPGLRAIFHGEAGIAMAAIAWVGVIVISTLVLAAILHGLA